MIGFSLFLNLCQVQKKPENFKKIIKGELQRFYSQRLFAGLEEDSCRKPLSAPEGAAQNPINVLQ